MQYQSVRLLTTKEAEPSSRSNDRMLLISAEVGWNGLPPGAAMGAGDRLPAKHFHSYAEWRLLMALRSVTSLLLGFSLAAVGSAVAQAQQDATSSPTQASAAMPSAAAPSAHPAPAASGPIFVVPAGTKIPLTL